MLEDTIVAVGTAIGESGIGIVRISGSNSINILKKIFIGKKIEDIMKCPSRYMAYGHIVDENNRIVDEVMVVIMRAPFSYTTEDVAEIHCHGGIVSIKRIIELSLNSGARLAEEGEFTKRAFLNGRIDLAQAEAVIDIITAKTDESLDNAVNQLGGLLSVEIKNIMDILMTILAHIEASIDFPEHDIEEMTNENVKKGIEDARKKIIDLLNTYDEGKILREGLNTAIVGRPNVGKSSLLNILLKENRAIVTDIPGTTRDIIEEYLNLGGILIKLIDTAGLRHTVDTVEKIGVEKTKEVIDRADLIIFVLDSSEPLTKEDFDILSLVENKKFIIVCNKIDLGFDEGIKEINELKNRLSSENIVFMSMKEHKGIKELEKEIVDIVYSGNVKKNRNSLVSNIRHKNLLVESKICLEKAIEAMDADVPIDLISLDIKDAWSYLGGITGDTVEEDIINEIFSRFCIGK